MGFSVLYVCTGNVCRSPMAELLFRAWLDPATPVRVASAGTKALVGHSIDRASASALVQLGIDPTEHRARRFEPWMAADADLVLTAERAQRDAVMTDVPRVFKKTFTMKEFARLTRHVEPDSDPVAFVATANAERWRVGDVTDDEDNVPDPYQGGINRAKQVVEEITETVYATVTVLGVAAEQLRARRPVGIRRRGEDDRPLPY